MSRRFMSCCLVVLAGCVCSAVAAANPPEWAVMECRGLKAWTDVIYYWIDRQNEDGSFGFGLNDDCEFYEMWPIVVMATDDQKIVASLRKAMDWVWYNEALVDGYQSGPRDVAHAAEVTSNSQPVMTIIDYGNPVFIERLMTTSKNVEKWTAINSKGHRHFRSNFFGSQEIYEHAYFGSDAGICARAMIPAMHLLWYNRDPYLARYCLEWGRAWVAHAKETAWGKPPGLLPCEVAFTTDEAAGFTHCWHTGAVTSLSQRIRLLELLVLDYMISGDAEFLVPARAELGLYGMLRHGYALKDILGQDKLSGGEAMTLPDEKARYARTGAELLYTYRWATDDHGYDCWWSGPLRMTREAALAAGQKAIQYARDQMEKAKKINVNNGTDNYAAKIDPLGQQFPLLYYGTDHSNPDFVDLPFPPVRWLRGNYELAVVMLADGRSRFKALCCNVGEKRRSFGAQLFHLDPGTYRVTLGIDANGDDRPERIVREDNVAIERGSILDLDLDPGDEYIVELTQLAKGPEWESRADVAVCSDDLFCAPASPEPGTEAELRVRVHNIGTQDAAQVSVVAEELGTGRIIGERTIEMLACPRALVPSSVIVSMPWQISPQCKGVRVRLDTGNLVKEIFKGNNASERALADLSESPRRLRPIYLPEWYRDQQKGSVPAFTVARVDKITIDGRLDDPGWQKARRIGPLNTNDNQPAAKTTYVRLAYDPDAFYVAVEAMEPRMDLVVAKAMEHDSPYLFVDDAVEVFIDSSYDKMNYYQFVANTAGVTGEGRFYNFTLYNGPWECKVQKGKDSWVAEARIPFKSVASRPLPGDTWGVNVYRTAMTFTMPEALKDREKGWKHMEQIALSPTYTGYHQVNRFAAVTFGP
jgi:hypothetical protein